MSDSIFHQIRRGVKDSPKDFSCVAGFDKALFAKALDREQTLHGKFRRMSSSTLAETCWALVSLMQADPLITDVRWMAYMLATAFKEGAQPVKTVQSRPKLGHNKKPILDKNKKEIMERHVSTRWDRVVPITEKLDKKHRPVYRSPLKVKRIDENDITILTKGSKVFEGLLSGAWVMERDGDQWVIDQSGQVSWQSTASVPGSTFGAPPVKGYTEFNGDEHAYVGRGYVQLTWFLHYVAAGVALNMGLALLFDPELANDRSIAYKIMSHGMRTGFGFANGHKFSMYFNGSKTDYYGARKMVNGQDCAPEIAAYAHLFEECLLSAKKK